MGNHNKKIRLKSNIYYALIIQTRCRTKYTKNGLYDGFEYYENRSEYEPVTEDRIIQLANLRLPYIAARGYICPEYVDNLYAALKVLRHSKVVFVHNIERILKELEEEQNNKGVSFNSRTAVSKTVDGGANPSTPVCKKK